MKKQTIRETFAAAGKLRPALKPFLDTFEPLFSKREETARKLAEKFTEIYDPIIPGNDDLPLLRKRPPGGLGPFIRDAAAELLPLIVNLDAFKTSKANLEKLFTNEENDRDLEILLEIYAGDSGDGWPEFAEKHGVDPQNLLFAADFIISAVLRAYASRVVAEDFPDWRGNICPVCGQPPVIAWLGKKPPVEDNEFLASGGGKKRLHCGVCGADWYFVRGICPSCGARGQDAMHIFGEEDRRHERVDWCKKCDSYLPLVDLREMAAIPDMDAMALCLMHLDLAAAQKGLEPLKPSFWNTY